MTEITTASNKSLTDLTDIYHDYEDTITVCPAPVDGTLKSLVTFEDCKTEPVHRWYSFKEGYSHRLLGELRGKGILPTSTRLRLLDPFCGVATTLLSCQLPIQDRYIDSAIGIERNPAIRFIANAKLHWKAYRIAEIDCLLTKLRNTRISNAKKLQIPSLSTFTATRKGDKRAFEQKALEDILLYKQWIEKHCAGKPEYEFFILAWTAVIGQSSNTRKDGRALRLIKVNECPNVKMLLVSQCQMMLNDLISLQETQPVTQTHILAGDARKLPFSNSSFTVICYSPPYLNNIDYSEVYKLELWLRGDVTNQDQFRALRLATFRSHPSVIFPVTSLCEQFGAKTWIRRLKGALIAALPADGFLRTRKALISNYIDDVLYTLKEQSRVAAPDAPIVCVVGNSLHGGNDKHQVPVCTDLLIAAAAQAVGLHIDHLQIARQLPRRDHQNGWLRETIIVMRKPRR